MRYEHLSQMILARASPHGVAFRVRRGDVYTDVPWSEVTPRLEAIAAGLLSSAALDDGACVSIVGNTSMESCLVDFAAMSVGLRTVPVYASLLPEEVGYMHVDTKAQLVVVENAAQLDKVRALGSPPRRTGRAWRAWRLVVDANSSAPRCGEGRR
jgi:long-chain acyl-CoA synthetase